MEPSEAWLSYKNIGGFFQVTKTLFDDKLKLWGSLRIDYNPYYKPDLDTATGCGIYI